MPTRNGSTRVRPGVSSDFEAQSDGSLAGNFGAGQSGDENKAPGLKYVYRNARVTFSYRLKVKSELLIGGSKNNRAAYFNGARVKRRDYS